MKKTLFVIALAVILLATLQAQDTARIEEIQRQMQQVELDLRAGRLTPQEAQTRLFQLSNEMQAAQQQYAQAQQQYDQTGTFYTQAQLDRLVELHDQHKSIQAQEHDGLINRTQADRQFAPIVQETQQIYATVTAPAARVQLEQEIERRINVIWPGDHPGWPTTEEWNYIMSRYGVGPFTQSRGTKASHTIPRIIQTGGNIDTVFQEMKNQLERAVRGKVIKIIANNNNEYRVELLEPGANPSANNGWFNTFSVGVVKTENGVSLGFSGYTYHNTATEPFPTPIR